MVIGYWLLVIDLHPSSIILHPSTVFVFVFVIVKVEKLFFSAVPRVFLFEVCNNDSYVVRDVTWA